MIRLPRPGGCPDQPAHLIAVIDSSGSVLGGTDPIGMRFTEMQVAITRVASRCKCDAELVSIVHFDTPVHNDLIAGKLTDTEAIERALKIPYDGAGCSRLGRSLTTARRLALGHPDHRNVLMALTDFQLFDPPHVWIDFVEFPSEVHACVLGGGYRGFDNNPRVTVTNVARTDQPGAVAGAVFSALASERSEVAITKLPKLHLVRD
jgi:hypothetical protein